MSPAVPDIEGMKEAQELLRKNFGQLVCFFFEEEETYPVGTPINPDTKRPYDVQIKPEDTDSKDPVGINCNVAFRPVSGMTEDTLETAVGNIKQNEVVVIMSTEEWATVEGAVAFTVKGDRYKLKKSTADGIGSEYRQLVWGEREGDA